jgi:diphthamide biosynthesis enzyme Dph1/Dph2-like protein
MKSKVLFIEARKKFNKKDIDLSILNKLPGKAVSLAATIQYLDLVPIVKKYLESKGKKTVIKQGAYYKAHILGCNSNAFDKKADTLLLLADGKFHAINNAIQLNKELYIYSAKKLEKITKQEINKIKQKTKAKQAKFLSSNNIGLILSIKSGQHYSNIYRVKEKIEKLDKQVYVFQSDNINIGELENFPQIQIWVNTACYGLELDSSNIINLQNILQFL